MKKLFGCVLCVMLLFFSAPFASAELLDISGGKGATDTTTDGVIFQTLTDAQQDTVSAGSGVVDPFLTIQMNGLESGYNSDYWNGGSGVLDTTRDTYNHSIQVSDLYGVTIGSTNYYEFLLDINESSGGDNSLLTQHELQVYLASSGNINPDLAALETAGTPVWDLDNATNGESTVLMDYDIWSGSGQNVDSRVLIPVSFFTTAGATDSDYVYLYAQFGFLNPLPAGSPTVNYPSTDGYEEYILREGGQGFPPPVPEPATMLLLGTALIGLAVLGRQKFFKKEG